MRADGARSVVALAIVSGLVAAAVTTPTLAAVDETLSSIVRGGRLYDNWYREIREPAPKEPHPAYPSGGKQAGDPGQTWRCVECHGWDYMGKDGAYAQGEHYTGIKGIRAMAGADPEKIVAVLKDATHRYGGLMADRDFQALANFVSRGQVDADRFIDRASGTAKGDSTKRMAYYQTICANCHGHDGLTMRDIPALSTIANDNPWKALHVIQNGHPDKEMLSLRVLGVEVLADVLAYVQSLPSEELLFSVVRGGRLYDNWYKEADHLAPTRPHPVYPSAGRYADHPETTWRCVECHGWDYMGKAGAYAEGEHYTGIKGIRGMAGADPEEIVAILKDTTHRYDGLIDYRGLRHLANFVSRGQVDMDRFIDRASGKAKGDRTRRAAYFQTICATCHGQDGLKILDMHPLGRVANTNPWKALHMILNGHPDEKMPALRVLEMEVLVDVLAYVQTLPTERYRRTAPGTPSR